jgi:hypothetical protein
MLSDGWAGLCDHLGQTMIAGDALGEAIGRGLGWSPGTFLAAYLENRQQATLSTLEDPMLANMVLKQVRDFFGLLEGCAPRASFTVN